LFKGPTSNGRGGDGKVKGGHRKGDREQRWDGREEGKGRDHSKLGGNAPAQIELGYTTSSH